MLDFKSSYKQLLHNCGKSTLLLQRLQKLMEVIYRILNGLYSSYLNDIIPVGELQQLQCQARLLVTSFSTIRYGKKSLSYLSPVLWNTLDDIKAKLWAISSDTHKLQLIKLHHFKLERFKSI